MNEVDNIPSWLVYERCVAAFASEEHCSFDTIVQPNVMIKGAISGEPRQIDVLIDCRWKQSSTSRIIIDAKEWANAVDIGDIEKFEGMMRDCRAHRGIIVCTKGYTKGAMRRAQDAINIKILSLSDIEEFSWLYEPCLGRCMKANRGKKQRGGVLWTEYMGIITNTGLILIVQTGKCDGCHSFHVWCWDCGIKFAVPDKKIISCGCDRNWAAVPESPETGHQGGPESVWLMMREDNAPTNQPIVFDRRPLR
jgi:hypothetical protein